MQIWLDQVAQVFIFVGFLMSLRIHNLLKYWMSVTKAVYEHIQLSIKIIEMMLDELKMEVLRLCHGSTSWGIGMQIQFARSCSLFSVVLYCLSYLFPKPDILF